MTVQNETELSTQPVFAARIGIDWADKKHFWTMQTSDGKIERGQLEHTPEAIELWVAGLAQRLLSKG